MATLDVVHEGLEGIVATETHLSDVNGEAGELTIAGYPLQELAPRATFEETVFLLWNGRLPDVRELERFRQALGQRRELPPLVAELLREAAGRGVPAMDALRMAAGALWRDPEADEQEVAVAILARLPSIIASYHRWATGQEPLVPRSDLGHAANYLYLLTGAEPTEPQVRALDTYLNTVVDHGLNASTFTARVVVSTGSDLVSAVVGAIGALKGPLHGGAPGPALDMVFEIGSEERIEPYLRAKLARGERLMGFGHRIYKVRDPRADVLAAAAEELARAGGDAALHGLAKRVEAAGLRLLQEHKPGRRLQTNVEFYTALLLHGLGLPTDLFTPTFATARAAGWIAHAFEQRRHGRLIRPRSVYSGPRGLTWVPVGLR